MDERILTLDAIDKKRKKNITIGGSTTLLHLVDTPEYVDARRDLESAEAHLMALQFKSIEERGYSFPNGGVATRRNPVIADSPVYPNVTQNLTLGAALGFLLFPLMALPVIWILSRSKRASCSGSE